jgi:hypothetical protein
MKWPAWLYRPGDARDDQLDRWKAPDKSAHVGWTAYAFALFGFWGAVALALFVEFVEALLWMRLPEWKRAALIAGEAGHRWPFFHDRASLKDLVADAAGIVVGVVVRFVLGLVWLSGGGS